MSKLCGTPIEDILPITLCTCALCCLLVGEALLYKSQHTSRHLCFECYTQLVDKAWRYDQLNK